jgi:hypothetical protein
MLDIFKNDAFSVMSLTDAINKVPFVPGHLGLLIPWQERGIAQTTLAIEEVEGTLSMVNPSPRGGTGEVKGKAKRTLRSLAIPHYERVDGIYADEVQGVREFGSEDSLRSLQSYVNGRIAEHTVDLDVTLEYQRVGAVKGTILNADGSTLYNLFTEFEVTQETETDFDLDNGSPASGALRKKCATVVRTMMDNLGGTPISGVHAICGNAFFDDLIAHPEVVESYQGTSMASVLRDGYVMPGGQKIYGAFEFGGIVFQNYRGSVGGSAFINTDKCHLFPVGPSLFRTVYAPADYIETVNTRGLPRYARQKEMQNGKGIDLSIQMNALSYCVRPKSLMQGKRT